VRQLRDWPYGSSMSRQAKSSSRSHSPASMSTRPARSRWRNGLMSSPCVQRIVPDNFGCWSLTATLWSRRVRALGWLQTRRNQPHTHTRPHQALPRHRTPTRRAGRNPAKPAEPPHDAGSQVSNVSRHHNGGRRGTRTPDIFLVRGSSDSKRWTRFTSRSVVMGDSVASTKHADHGDLPDPQ
jgi:hypothetical protein